MTDKEKIIAVVESLPDDASYEEILRQLAFEEMLNRGLSDLRKGSIITNDEMKKRIVEWH